MSNLATLSPPTPLDHDEQLAAQIILLAGQINAANHRLLKLIAEFDDCKGWSGGGTVRSCAHWLNWKVGIALGAAREKVRVATPENEDFLLTIARYGTASHVEQVVNKYRGVQRSLDDTEAQKSTAGRSRGNVRRVSGQAGTGCADRYGSFVLAWRRL